MAGVVSRSLQIYHPFPSSLKPSPTVRRSPQRILPAPPRAVDGDAGDPEDEKNQEPKPESPTTTAATSDPSFDSRLAQVRLKYRSGSGKKAEQRKARMSGKKSGGGGGGVMLPPVPLREPTAAGGLAVEAGFTPYSERLNGRLATLGLVATLLVELGSGQGLLKYHSPPVIFIQVYTVAAAAALFIKFEKERISVWPEKPPSPATEVSSN